MTKPKALLLGKIDHEPARKDWEALSDVADLVEPHAKDRDEFTAKCKSGDYDGVVAAYRTFDSVSVTGRIDKDLLDVLPKSLKYIAHNGAGYDQIDVADCTEHGVNVSNVPTIVDDATADNAVWLTLGMLRNFGASVLTLRENNWRGKPAVALGHDPQGKVLGILGMGGIGRNYARKMRAFGVTVIYHNRHELPSDEADGAKYVSFEELLQTSDILSLNLPLNKNTEKIISTKQFDMMKKSAIVVNTARGGVIDEDAFVKALDEGKIAGAGLDVYANEPHPHPGLVSNKNVLLLPHMGTYTVETQTRMEQWTIANVKSAITKGELLSRVPEQKDVPYPK